MTTNGRSWHSIQKRREDAPLSSPRPVSFRSCPGRSFPVIGLRFPDPLNLFSSPFYYYSLRISDLLLLLGLSCRIPEPKTEQCLEFGNSSFEVRPHFSCRFSRTSSGFVSRAAEKGKNQDEEARYSQTPRPTPPVPLRDSATLIVTLTRNGIHRKLLSRTTLGSPAALSHSPLLQRP